MQPDDRAIPRHKKRTLRTPVDATRRATQPPRFLEQPATATVAPTTTEQQIDNIWLNKKPAQRFPTAGAFAQAFVGEYAPSEALGAAD